MRLIDADELIKRFPRDNGADFFGGEFVRKAIEEAPTVKYVSDEAAEAVVAELKVTREKRRGIQSMTQEQLQRYLVYLYRQGFEAGADAIQQHLEMIHEQAEEEALPFEDVQVAWEDVLAVIAQVKGIGPKMLEKIDSKLKETY
ncbi:MAG: hypothetical protein IJJ80_04910 [Clostridia bacterium]|nr:hypothetical protein [Clostridia bacterium]